MGGCFPATWRGGGLENRWRSAWDAAQTDGKGCRWQCAATAGLPPGKTPAQAEPPCVARLVSGSPCNSMTRCVPSRWMHAAHRLFTQLEQLEWYNIFSVFTNSLRISER